MCPCCPLSIPMFPPLSAPTPNGERMRMDGNWKCRHTQTIRQYTTKNK
jgi:hypothetical protein